jgi:hypothetical protein
MILALVLIGYGDLWVRKRFVFDVHFILVFKEFNFHFFAGNLLPYFSCCVLSEGGLMINKMHDHQHLEMSSTALLFSLRKTVMIGISR